MQANETQVNCFAWVHMHLGRAPPMNPIAETFSSQLLPIQHPPPVSSCHTLAPAEQASPSHELLSLPLEEKDKLVHLTAESVCGNGAHGADGGLAKPRAKRQPLSN